jgi:hypothetical protein
MDSWNFRMGTALLREPARPSQTMAKVSCPAAGRYVDLPEPTLKCGLPNMYPYHPAEVPYAPEIRRSRRSGRGLTPFLGASPTRLPGRSGIHIDDTGIICQADEATLHNRVFVHPPVAALEC